MKLPIWIRRSLRPVLVGAALFTVATACAGYVQPNGDVVWVRMGPPAPRYEVRSQAPGPDFIWISGYHRWNGAAYDWAPGRWERRPQPRSRWVEGRWRHERRGYFYVEGHWQNRR